MTASRRPSLVGRQRKLLGLLSTLGGRAANLDFQKILFLYCIERNGDAPYEFIPYKYGAFSFTSYADRRKLVERGLLEDVEAFWQLTAEGSKAADAESPVTTDLIRNLKGLRGNDLIAETYRSFPYYAIRSEIAHRVLAGDPAALQRIEEARPRGTSPGLYTLGYEGRSLESYLNRLIGASVQILCDVRRNPLSRKYGFSKSTLKRACEGVGIDYHHLPELGISSDKRKNLKSQADYDALFEEYEKSSLPNQGAAISRICDWIRGGGRVSLTCFENTPERCHRHCVAEAVERDLGLTAVHL